MQPQLASIMRGWTKPTQLRVVNQTPADFEVFENVLAVEWFDAMLTVMSAQAVDRKPENLRTWKFWECSTTKAMDVDAVVQDFNGLQMRVQAKYDMSQNGFYKYDLCEQPNQSAARPADGEAQQ